MNESNALFEIFEKIEFLIQNLDEENKEVIILGDFNCDLLPVVKGHHTRKFLDLINIPIKATYNTSNSHH